MRTFRRTIEIALPVVGTGIVLLAVLLIIDLRAQLIAVLFGLLLVEMGVWGLARTLLPNERQYLELRTEVDHFIDVVRAMNAITVEAQAAGEPPGPARAQLADEMYASVERMLEAAGKTDRSPRPREDVAVP